MRTLIKNGKVFTENGFVHADVLIENSVIACVGEKLEAENAEIIDASGLIVSPGFIDLHVHLREPGFEAKETIATGTQAAAHGGFTTVCAMPNLNPMPDCLENLEKSLDIINRDAKVNVLPYCAITRGERGEELVDFGALAEKCVAFSDDGKGVQTQSKMREAMVKVSALGGLICAHCEDESLLKEGGCVHDGAVAKKFGVVGISSASEFAQVQRDVKIAQETGCRYHVCHVSTAETLEAVREAKAAGARVSCEITPHHAILCEDDIEADDGKYKMNPPLRAKSDRAAIIAALLDGTADAIATDHAPHTPDEKSRGLAKSAMGIVGLETAFSILHTKLVTTSVLPLERLLYLMTFGPAAVLGKNYGIKAQNIADITLIDCSKRGKIDSKKFYSKGSSTPFEGENIEGRVVATICGGKTIYKEGITI